MMIVHQIFVLHIFLLIIIPQLNAKEIIQQTIKTGEPTMTNKFNEGSQNKLPKNQVVNKISDNVKDSQGAAKPITFTILYDNYVCLDGTIADWGFSCLIEGTEKTILFDTGTKPDILLHNVKKMNVDIKKIKQIVISHNHYDHIGGLESVLNINHDVTVYIPHSIPVDVIQKLEKLNARVTQVSDPVRIGENVYLTGEMGDRIKEQSLIINSSVGLIIITGCSHPGIINILKRARELFKKEIFLVFGGFHLRDYSNNDLREIVKEMKALNTVKCGATHCTGDKSIKFLSEAFGDNYIKMGTGRILKINDKGLLELN